MLSIFQFSNRPDTTELELRVGIHTGQVTAGVLRGERARFQLFGDAVNTAEILERTSRRSGIHISESTATELRKFGKGRWILPRSDKVAIKGKGETQTFWLETKSESARKGRGSKAVHTTGVEMAPITEASTSADDTSVNMEDIDDFGDDGIGNMTKTERLVEWNVEVLSFLLKQILAARETSMNHKRSHTALSSIEARIGESMTTVLDEFKEIIELPHIEARDLKKRRDPNTINLEPRVVSQLRDLLTDIAGMYHENDFHNFEHASHVTASVRKLLTRIVNAGTTKNGLQSKKGSTELVDLAGHSYGIVSHGGT